MVGLYIGPPGSQASKCNPPVMCALLVTVQTPYTLQAIENYIYSIQSLLFNDSIMVY